MNRTLPAVFAVENKYQIIVPVEKPSLMWVEVDGKKYCDEVNGVLRSDVEVHRMTVPMAALDKAKSYTVVEREIINRDPYFPKASEERRQNYNFKPVEGENLRAYCISDTHGMKDEPIAAAKAYGKIDFLILNGDIADFNHEIWRYQNTYDIASEVTGGEIPIVFARGNHDLRGFAAEKQVSFMPNDNGNTFYTFKLGNVHGIVLDCGEDKADENDEYGGTICCHDFRLRVTDFLRKVCESGEFKEDEHRIVLCHIPFTYRRGNIFNIEEALYAEWARLLKEYIKPELMICGHLHILLSSPVGSKWDHLGQPCPMLIASEKGDGYYCGCGIEFSSDSVDVTYIDSSGAVQARASSPDFVFEPCENRTIPEWL